MAKVIPFKGLLYNPDKVGDYGKVIAPPYDVISKEMQDDLYNASDYNIIRLIDNRSEGEGRYSEAAQNFDQWQNEQVLVEDEKEAIYVYEQDFEYHGQIMHRKGFLAALKIEPLGQGLIYPHERTMSKPKEDRLKLLKATNANLSPIFALYIDSGQIKAVLDKVSQKEPDIETSDSAGVVQKLWRLTDAQDIAKISQAMKGKELFIADGHHRYETSLMYKQEQTLPDVDKPSDYTMMMFVDMDSDGVVIKPTHRIVSLDSVTFDQLKDNLRDDFELEQVASLDEVTDLLKASRDKVVFGLSDGKEFWFLRYKLDEKEFDLLILHRELKRYLGIESSTVQDFIKFSADARQALSMAGKDKAVFFVNPTPINTVKDMARSHQIMPQKSTYFYPKLTDGLVIRKLN